MMLRGQIVFRKLNVFGHLTRHDRLEKMIIQERMEGVRSRGRLRRTWDIDIQEWTGDNLGEASRLAEDRGRWRASMKTTAAYL